MEVEGSKAGIGLQGSYQDYVLLKVVMAYFKGVLTTLTRFEKYELFRRDLLEHVGSQKRSLCVPSLSGYTFPSVFPTKLPACTLKLFSENMRHHQSCVYITI